MVVHLNGKLIVLITGARLLPLQAKTIGIHVAAVIHTFGYAFSFQC